MSTPHEIRFPVESTHVLMFERALGRLDAALLEWGDSVPAVTFPVAVAQFDPDYELRPNRGRPWFGSGKVDGSRRPSTSDDATRLHAEIHFEYRRPLRISDELQARRRPGRTWTKERTRGGTLRFSEVLTEFVDDRGDVVVTMCSVGVEVPKDRTATDD